MLLDDSHCFGQVVFLLLVERCLMMRLSLATSFDRFLTMLHALLVMLNDLFVSLLSKLALFALLRLQLKIFTLVKKGSTHLFTNLV